ncbi:MAG: 50S ribosomal protein L21 [Hyphomicrobiales bacterium]|nr:50S ribosomal protein L21 [Hyphomicrobiales bacterium]
MFAIFKTGGKQYKVQKDGVLKIEKIAGNAGDVVVFDEVILTADDKGKATVGAPLVKDVKVSAEILGQDKDDKVLVFKKKRRHNYRRKRGHRQQVTWVKVQEIGTGLTAKAGTGAKAAPKKAAAEAKETAKEAKASAKPAAAKKADKPAAKKPAAKKTPAKKTDKE